MEDEKGRKICGYIKDDDEPCRHVAGWGTDHLGTGRCMYHPGPGGAPEGNKNAVGHSGGAPEGHFRNLEHGERTSADRWMEFIEDEADDRFEELYKHYVAELTDEGASRTQAARIARLWTRADWNDMQLIEEDFETEHYFEGELVGMRFDSDRDSSVIKSERAARLIRREEELSPHSQQSAGTEVLIRGGEFDANISHNRVESESETETDTEDTEE